MSGLLTKILAAPVKFPVVRGMLSYAIIWPSCSLVQEYLEHGTSLKKANWARAARFSFFGTFFMAPVFYGWMKYSSRFFKRKDLMTAISRAAVEQVSYSPLAMAYFFFGMSMLEGKPYRTCVNEVREKFWPTYKIGMVFWPTAQTFNFYFVSEKNRIVFVSLASFVWTVYLAHMKGKEQKNEPFIGSDPQPLTVEPMSGSLDPESKEVDSVLDKTQLMVEEMAEDHLAVEEISPETTLVNVGEMHPDLMDQQKPVIEIQAEYSNPEENPPTLVSDVRVEGEESHLETHLAVETLVEPEEEEQEDETSEELEDMMELLKVMPS